MQKIKKKNIMIMIFKREQQKYALSKTFREKQNDDKTQNRKQWSLSRKKTQEKNKTITRTRRERGGRKRKQIFSDFTQKTQDTTKSKTNKNGAFEHKTQEKKQKENKNLPVAFL